MVTFGEKIPVGYNGSKPRHLGVRAFIPVFKRTVEVSNRDIWSGKRTVSIEPRYERWGHNFWDVLPARSVKPMWAISRVRRARVGQLVLF